MFDGSHYPLEENVRRTAEYVERFRDRVTIEGAVDEIAAEEDGIEDELCTPERAKRFVEATGVDLIVPNVGTEHRATVEKARYRGDVARAISKEVGKILVLHGTSSLGEQDLSSLPDDGVIKVNIWTRLARLGAQAVARRVLEDVGCILSEGDIREFMDEGLLGSAFVDKTEIERRWGGELGPKLQVFAECVRRDAWVGTVLPAIKEYLYAFGYGDYDR
jgi:fructose-bisphosphate aldolase class II